MSMVLVLVLVLVWRIERDVGHLMRNVVCREWERTSEEVRSGGSLAWKIE